MGFGVSVRAHRNRGNAKGSRMNSALMFSAKSDDWSTPQDTFAALDAEFSFDFDPCPIGGGSGLTQDWLRRAFVNPPYSNVRGFLDKAMQEIDAGRTDVAVFLVPSRTDTKWWHEVVMTRAAEIRFIKGRLKFGGSKNSAPFPSTVIVFKRADSNNSANVRGLP